ncbi:DivIVA domain-containing protein [Micromonospora peucetia]|uniref:DivIVA domain-containing protein n=1 Tax=Micromonospora peucetia TaxID=47871 RepID=A0A1C6UNR6_9ACTN|nr:DivIVA domain-containing protein [Micromonospora peucetia]
MRNLIRRLTGRHEQRRPADVVRPPRGLRPWQIRDRCFNVRRRGLDPVEIRAFLHQVADELTVAQTALVAVQEENVRIKKALSAWQSAQPANHRYR